MTRMSREDRLAQAEECLASGMTVRDWCAANGVVSVGRIQPHAAVLRLHTYMHPGITSVPEPHADQKVGMTLC